MDPSQREEIERDAYDFVGARSARPGIVLTALGTLCGARGGEGCGGGQEEGDEGGGLHFADSWWWRRLITGSGSGDGNGVCLLVCEVLQ